MIARVLKVYTIQDYQLYHTPYWVNNAVFK